MERRSFLAFLGGATSHTLWETYKSGIVDPLVEPLKCWVAGSLSWGAIATPQTIHQRPELVWDIFFSSRLRTEFIPPTDWGPTVPDVQLPGGTKTYGHEASVLSSIANFLSLSGPLIAWEVHDKSWLADRDCSQVMLASGRSNVATQAVIGTPEAPIFTPKLGETAVKLQYAIGLGSGHPKRLQYHKELQPRAMSVCQNGRGPILQAETSGGWQKDDYLLVTRIPGPSPDSVYTVLSGLHGPGTRSAELLLNAISLRDLQELASMIDHKPGHVSYFQAVFRASQFKKFDGSDVATEIELVTSKCPPVRIENL